MWKNVETIWLFNNTLYSPFVIKDKPRFLVLDVAAKGM